MEPELAAIVSFFVFAFGACVASFLNVVIWRVPRGESVISPPSHCPKCGAPIRWYQNLPILSWLALRGRCANCRAPISCRYLLVETLGGVLFLLAFWRSGAAELPHPLTFAHLLVLWTWIALMIVGSFIDFDHRLLPDFVTVGGMALGVGEALVFSLWRLLSAGPEVSLALKLSPLFWSLAGLAFGFGLLWTVRAVGSKVFRREAMGMGDVFLLGAVGALGGPVHALLVLVLSSVFGSLVGIPMMACAKWRLGRFVEIPYGPYICLGALVAQFWGNELIVWYVSLMK